MSRIHLNKSRSTALEYGLIAAGISLAIIAVMNSFGTVFVNLAAHLFAS